MGQILKAAAALTAMIASAPAFAAWEPTKPVEIVVAAGAGGASDQMARMMQAAIQKNNLMKQPMVVSLKGGASGAEALMYMKSSDGDANKVLIAYSLIYMLPLSAKIPFNWRDLTPVSVVALDQFVLWDNAAGPKTVKEFIAAAKAASSPFKMGGTGSKREDHVLTVFMEQKTGAKFSYLPYKSGGEAATQLVGKHTESNVNNPSENLEVWRAGQVRALCVFDKERIAYKTKVTETQSWNDIPTCKEEGLDVQYLMLRAMFLPGKVTPEQQAFYVDLFQKVTQTPEYKDYMEKQALKPIFLTGKDMVKFLEEDDKLNASLMNEAGFVGEVTSAALTPTLLLRVAVSGHADADFFDLLFRQQRRLADLQAAVILPRQRLDLDRKPHRLRQRRPDRDHAVMVQQAGQPALQRAHGMFGKLLRAEGRIGRAADGVAAGAGDHVMHRRNLHAHDREHRRVGRVRVDDGVHVRPRLEDIAVKPPLARRALGGIVRAVEIHVDDLLGLHRLVGRAGRRDQQAVAVAQADIARRALVDAERIHAQAGVDDGLALFPVFRGRHFNVLLQPADNG